MRNDEKSALESPRPLGCVACTATKRRFHQHHRRTACHHDGIAREEYVSLGADASSVFRQHTATTVDHPLEQIRVGRRVGFFEAARRHDDSAASSVERTLVGRGVDALSATGNHRRSRAGQFSGQLACVRKRTVRGAPRADDGDPRTRRHAPPQVQSLRRIRQIGDPNGEPICAQDDGSHGVLLVLHPAELRDLCHERNRHLRSHPHRRPRRRPKVDAHGQACGTLSYMKVLVATHGHCFDGLCSAVIFSRLLQHLEGDGLAFSYRACGYGVNQQTAAPEHLTGELNAILDYRFTASDKVDWYFDHHRTAFANDADRQYFDERAAQSNRLVFDADFSSCTKLIYETAIDRFGLEADFDELVHWADLVDSAAFDSAAAAIEKSNPVMRLVSVVEHQGNDAFLAQLSARLLTQPLQQVAESADIQRRYAPLGKRHDRFVAAVRAKAQTRGRVVFVDLTEKPLEMIGKFVTYALYPDSVYSVVVARLQHGFKISVGYNPWCGHLLDTDISSICARYGGGGHTVVGGISVADGQRAQTIAQNIADELAS